MKKYISRWETTLLSAVCNIWGRSERIPNNFTQQKECTERKHMKLRNYSYEVNLLCGFTLLTLPYFDMELKFLLREDSVKYILEGLL